MSDANLVVVHTFGSRPETDMAKIARSGGNRCYDSSRRSRGMRPHLAWAGGGFKVLVREEDAAAEREVGEPPAELA
jgi:hypothetical protein